MSLLLVGSVGGYYCIYEEDNEAVMNLKYNMNMRSLQNDFNNGLTEEAIILKLKYFNPCK
jgi:hypothetical protein